MLLTIQQTADRLSTTKRAVKTMTDNGLLAWIDVSTIKGSKKPRKRVLESDLIAFIESRKKRVPTIKQPRRSRCYKERIGV